MKGLEAKIKALAPTTEEEAIFRRVDKYYKLCDLRDILNHMIESEDISQKQASQLSKKSDDVVERYEDYRSDGDQWIPSMTEAINYYLD